MKLVIQVNEKETSHSNRIELQLTQKGLLIGRKKADIVIPDVKCSLRHAAIVIDSEKKVWIQDLQSTNGLRVNGKKVTKVQITESTLIKIGNTLIYIESMSEGERPALKEDVIHNWPHMFQAVRKKREFSSYL